MENFKTPVPVVWSNQLILTTAQLAECYTCEVHNIKKNFNQNKSRFIEGKHYFKVTGNALKNLRVTVGDLQISPKTRTMYLWTERGAARHAKMLSTDKAWEVFEKLEDNYFSQNASVQQFTPAPKPALVNARSEAQKRDAFVYVLLMSDGTVKIGQNSKLQTRIAQIKSENKLTVCDIHFTPKMSREDARLIEWACKEKFSSRCVKGEFFSVAFEEACAVIDSFAKVLTVSHAVKLIAAVATKLIVDKKLD